MTNLDTNLIELQIPFDGFYYTLSGESFDVMRYGDDYDDSGDPTELEELTEPISKTKQAYCEAYIDSFIKELQCTDITVKQYKFSEIYSPRFYNYGTDMLYIKIDKETAINIIKNAKADIVADLVNKMFTSRDGFHSFYSNDPNRYLNMPIADILEDANISYIFLLAHILEYYNNENEFITNILLNDSLNEVVRNYYWENSQLVTI